MPQLFRTQFGAPRLERALFELPFPDAVLALQASQFLLRLVRLLGGLVPRNLRLLPCLRQRCDLLDTIVVFALRPEQFLKFFCDDPEPRLALREALRDFLTALGSLEILPQYLHRLLRFV